MLCPACSVILYERVALSLFINDKNNFRKAESIKFSDTNRRKLDESLEHFK